MATKEIMVVRKLRITSYNVCYTKLLRPQADDVIEFIGMSDTVFNTLYMTAPLYFRATNYCHPEFFDLDIIDILTDGEGLDENVV